MVEVVFHPHAVNIPLTGSSLILPLLVLFLIGKNGSKSGAAVTCLTGTIYAGLGDDHGKHHIVSLTGDWDPDQGFPAQQNAPVRPGGKKAVIVAASLPQPVSQMVATDAGNDGQLHAGKVQPGGVRDRLQNAVCAGPKLFQVLNVPQLYLAGAGT